MNQIELTILMPCLNEERTLDACISKAKAFLVRANVSGEILVSDNGSMDGSVNLAQALGARVVEATHRGYGAALMAGINSAKGSYIIMGDSDDSYDFSALDDYLAKLRQGFDLVMGNRFKGGISVGAMPFLHRYLGNPVLSFIGRLFFRVPIGDFHCGLRGFSRESILRLGLVTQGMEFASEMVVKSALAGYKIAEVPTTLRPDGRGRPAHLRTWRDGWRHLRFLLLFCPRWLFLYPGALLVVVGLLGFIGLMNGPLEVIAFTLGIHSLMYMAGATILGLQLIQMALLIKWLGALSEIVAKPQWLIRWPSWLTIEGGVLAGAGLFLAGLYWSAQLLLDWRNSGFGALNPVQSMRSVIPAVTLMIIGVQTAAGAFFAGALHFCWSSWNRRQANND